MTQPTSGGIAFFDLDHTLVDGDSDSSFIEYLAESGVLDAEVLAAKEPIGRAYMAGEPWQAPYRDLLRRIYQGRPVAETVSFAAKHAKDRVLPMLFAGARALVEKERERRSEVVLLTTTNQIVTGPVARLLGLDGLLSSRLEVSGDQFSGEVIGEFCTGPGKAIALRAYCAERGVDPADCAMYGDGRSDMDALGAVGEPHAVHPNEELARVADAKGWPVLQLS